MNGYDAWKLATPPWYEDDECPQCDGAEYDEETGDCPHGFYCPPDRDDQFRLRRMP